MTQPISYFDANVFIGRSAGARPYGGKDCTAESLLAEMDRLGIDEAAVYHIVAREHAPASGNRQLIAELAGNPRLHPVAVVLPSHTGEMPPPDLLVEELSEQRFAFARMFPATDAASHRFALREWNVGPLLSALEGARIPLMLDFGLFRRGEPPWDDIVAVCDPHPELAVILMDVQGRNNRSLYALLDRYPNLFVQTAGFNVHRGLEDVAARFGAERLIFGSGYPVGSMGAARFQVERADLPDEAKALIAGGVLRGLEGGRGLPAREDRAATLDGRDGADLRYGH